MTSAIDSFGTLLKIGDGGATESFTTIAEVKDITGPGLEQAANEVTSHGSTNGWREFIGGLKDGGEVTFEVNFVPTGATHDETTGLIAELTGGTVTNYQVVWPDSGSTTWQFAALCTAFEPGAPVDGVLMASVTLKISGEPTITV